MSQHQDDLVKLIKTILSYLNEHENVLKAGGHQSSKVVHIQAAFVDGILATIGAAELVALLSIQREDVIQQSLTLITKMCQTNYRVGKQLIIAGLLD